MVIHISWKFEKASYNIFFGRAVMVKSLSTLWQRNKVKSTVSTVCYPVYTIIFNACFNTVKNKDFIWMQYCIICMIKDYF